MMIMVLTVQFFQPGIAFAGDGNDKTFSLNEAVQMATANNTLIKEAIENQKAAMEEEKSVKKVAPIPAHRAGHYGLTESRQLSYSDSKSLFIPVHRTGHSGCFRKRIRFIHQLCQAFSIDT
jgi:hypothetical protein